MMIKYATAGDLCEEKECLTFILMIAANLDWSNSRFCLLFCLLPNCIFAYLPIICVSSTYMCATNHITDPLHGQLISVFFAEFHIEMKCWAPCMFHSVCNVAPAPYLKSYQIEIWQFGEFNIGIGSRCRCNQWISVNGVEFETPIGLEPQTRAQFILFL